jgi:hypothetical protein
VALKKTSIMKYYTYVFLLFLFVSCSENDDNQINPEVADYLNEAVDIMEEYSINRSDIDWVDFRNQVLDEGASAQTIEDVDSALLLALTLLNEEHSFIVRQDDVLLTAAQTNCENTNLSGSSTPDNINRFWFPPYDGASFSRGLNSRLAYAETVQGEIQNRDNPNITGWIIDLRNNNSTGGIYTLLTAIGPILGEGTAGYYVYPEFGTEEWSYEDGEARSNQSRVVWVPEPYELINPNPKVAVLINQATSSTAESLAIAFKDRPNTVIIGSESCEPTLHNLRFVLSDFSYLNLAVAYVADRNGNEYQNGLVPDIVTNDEPTAIQEAINFINN